VKNYEMQAVQQHPVIFDEATHVTAACCRHPHPEWWWPETPSGGHRADAYEVCARCPLTGDGGPCVQDAVNHADPGIRGGTTILHRKRLLASGVIARQAVCLECGDVFKPSRRRYFYCTAECSHVSDRRRHNREVHNAQRWLAS